MNHQIRPRSGPAWPQDTGAPQEYASYLLQNSSSVLLSQGEVLFQRGAPGDGCYWLQTGVLKVGIVSQHGEERILAVLGPGSIVGEMAMIDALPRPATVAAIIDCQLVFVSAAAFRACLRDHPEMYRHLVSTLVAHLRQAYEEAVAASFLTVKARVARALLQFAEYLGQEIDHDWIELVHRVPQNDVASLAGVARESVSRTLSDWSRRGVISKRSPHRYVIHKEKLQREATDLVKSKNRNDRQIS